MFSYFNFDRSLALAIGAILGGTFIGAPASVTLLQERLKVQCASADWPAHQDLAHRDFCAAEGLPVYKPLK